MTKLIDYIPMYKFQPDISINGIRYFGTIVTQFGDGSIKVESEGLQERLNYVENILATLEKIKILSNVPDKPLDGYNYMDFRNMDEALQEIHDLVDNLIDNT